MQQCLNRNYYVAQNMQTLIVHIPQPIECVSQIIVLCVGQSNFAAVLCSAYSTNAVTASGVYIALYLSAFIFRRCCRLLLVFAHRNYSKLVIPWLFLHCTSNTALGLGSRSCMQHSAKSSCCVSSPTPTPSRCITRTVLNNHEITGSTLYLYI